MRKFISTAREFAATGGGPLPLRTAPSFAFAFPFARFSGFALLCGGFAVYAPCAYADDIRDTPDAEALFSDGKMLFAQGRTSDACTKFASSYHIDPQVGTLLFLATCHEAEGKTASAWSEFNAAVSAMQIAHNARRETYAQQHLEALSGKLSRLVLAAPTAPNGLEVKLDDQRIEPDALGISVPVNPGPHTVSAIAPGHRPWSTTFDVAPGPSDLTVTVPQLEREPSGPAASAPSTVAPSAPSRLPPGPPAAAVAPSSASAVPVPGERAPGSATNAGVYFAGGIGIAGLAVGVATGIVAVVDKTDADSGSCVGKYCTQHGLDLYSRATTAAWISTGAFAAGATGVAVAASALLFGHRPQGDRTHLQVLPTLGGLQLSAAW
ncbi:MAG TPA: hypothetical protein VEK07_07615 [Polyangiaceae bacterium]|nr:hypothetical protein [Polyangiaceae bacterium]